MNQTIERLKAFFSPAYLSTLGENVPSSSIAFRRIIWSAHELVTGGFSKFKISLKHSPAQAYLYPSSFMPTYRENLPQIDGLLVVAGKDFATLPLAIESLIIGSVNSIRNINVITPGNDLGECATVISSLRESVKANVRIFNEDDIISQELRADLRTRFGSRYGWVLQQLLTVKHVFDSDAKGVLVLDADTVLLRPRIWLTAEGTQPLLVSAEYWDSYYRFLSTLGISERYPERTHVTHHMLMQPSVLRGILDLVKLTSIEALAAAAIRAAGLDENSPVCLEYEVYGQGISKFFREKAIYVKFSNLGIAMDPLSASIDELQKLYGPKFYSVSLHHYLQNSRATTQS